MTPSDRRGAVLSRLSGSSSEPRWTSAPRGRERGAFVVRAAEAEHLMAGGDQFLDDGRADEAGGAGDENTHEQVSRVSLETNLALMAIRGKVVTLSWYNG